MVNEKRLIDANETYEIARTSGLHDDFGRCMADLTSLKELFEDAPTVDAVEVVHGRWIWHDEDKFFTCSNCEYSALNNYRGNSVESNYCPNCGAKMDKEVIWLNN